MRITAFLLILLVTFSNCSKERIEEHPEWIGSWSGPSYSDDYGSGFLRVNENGSAQIRIVDFSVNIGGNVAKTGKFGIREEKLYVGNKGFDIEQPIEQLDLIILNRNTTCSHTMMLDGQLFCTDRMEDLTFDQLFSEYIGSWSGTSEFGDVLLTIEDSSGQIEVVFDLQSNRSDSLSSQYFINADSIVIQSNDSATVQFFTQYSRASDIDYAFAYNWQYSFERLTEATMQLNMDNLFLTVEDNGRWISQSRESIVVTRL